jgi:hypothetical protein
MKNNRGEITLEEMLKIILAIMGIIILGLLVLKLYDIFVSGDKHQLEQAKASLAKIKDTISSLKSGEEKSIIIESPLKWNILFYSKLDTLKPASCKDKNCICLCGKDFTNAKPEYCDLLGVCENFDFDFEVSSAFPKTFGIDSGVSVYMKPLDKISPLFFHYEIVNGKETIFITPKTSIVPGAATEVKWDLQGILDKKTNFLDKGEISLREQIIYWYNSCYKENPEDTVFLDNLEMRNELKKNIDEILKDYPYLISFQFTGEDLALSSTLAKDRGVSFNFCAGKDVYYSEKLSDAYYSGKIESIRVPTQEDKKISLVVYPVSSENLKNSWCSGGNLKN